MGSDPKRALFERNGGQTPRGTIRVPLMLRAALIGFGSSGKTTLFQLMTSARETARAAHGKGETSVGISKVPDPRLDRLTAMYNPRKRVPATVEFTGAYAQSHGSFTYSVNNGRATSPPATAEG